MTTTRLRALRDRYLPVLALSLLLCAGASAQTNYYQPVNNNFAWRNGYFQRAMGTPTDTISLDAAERSRPHVAVKNDTFYVWSPAANRWKKANGAGGTLQAVTDAGNGTTNDIVRLSGGGGSLVTIGQATSSQGHIQVADLVSGSQSNILPSNIESPTFTVRDVTSGFGGSVGFVGTDERTFFLPDKNGTFAMLDDVAVDSFLYATRARLQKVADSLAALTPATPGLADVLGVSGDAGGNPITNLPAPSGGSDAATKDYVDDAIVSAASDLQGVLDNGNTAIKNVTLYNIGSTNSVALTPSGDYGSSYVRITDAGQTPSIATYKSNLIQFTGYAGSTVAIVAPGTVSIGNHNFRIPSDESAADKTFATREWIAAQGYSTGAGTLQAVTDAGATTTNLVTINRNSGGVFTNYYLSDFAQLGARVDGTEHPFRAYNPFDETEYTAFGSASIKRRLSGVDYTLTLPSTSGTLALTSAIPTNNNTLTNGANYITQAGARSAISLTTTGTSGAATYNSTTGVLNIPQYTGGSGTVTDVSITSANGFAGSVGTSTTTPSITLSTTVNGMVKGNGTALSAAVAGTDYVAPTGLIPYITTSSADAKYEVVHSPATYAESGSEFMHSVGEFTTVASGTGTGIALVSSDVNHPGIIRVTTGSTATGRTSLQASTLSSYYLGSGALSFETSVYLPSASALSNGTDRYQLLVGLVSTTTSVNQTSGVYFLYDEGGVSTGSSASANWQLVCANTVGRTFQTTSTAVALTTWVRLRAEVNAAGTSVQFYINGTPVGTPITTNIPTTISSPLGWSVYVQKSLGTAARLADADFMKVVQTVTR